MKEYAIRSYGSYMPRVVINNTDGMKLGKARTAADKAQREENKKKFYDGFASPRKRN